MKNIGVILSGGIGARFKNKVPKQYFKIDGKEIISYSIDAFLNSSEADDFIVIVDEREYFEKKLEKKYGVKCVLGGSSRNSSLYNAIKYLKENVTNCENVLIHEAARPFIRADIIDTYFKYLSDYDGVITAKEITDSLGRDGEAVTDRSEYYLIQAPEAFKFNLLYKHFKPDSSITATVQQLPFDIKVKRYYDFVMNYKITFPEDILIAEQLIKNINS